LAWSTRFKVLPLPALRRERAGKSAAATVSASPSPQTVPEPVELARRVAAQLEADKAENILEIDLTGKFPMADAMVIASGRSQRHVAALADHVARRLKDEGVHGVRVEGLPNADWVLIDAGDIIIHIFRPEVREFYDVERIWGADAIKPSTPTQPVSEE
jgi:ribosome-associated protein